MHRERFCLFSKPALSVDIDECLNTTTCDANAECNNTYGSFLCTCNAGYEGNGFTCTGRDWIIVNDYDMNMFLFRC